MKYLLLLSCILMYACTTESNKKQVISSNNNINKNNDTTTSNKNKPQIIKLGDNFDNTKQIKLSDIAIDIEYVKLETKPECYIGGGNNTYFITNKYIFVFNRRKLFQFKRDGKFIRQIGKEGRGPGEFISMKGIAVNEKDYTVSIISNYKHKILEFNFDDGQYLRSCSVDPIAGSSMLKGAFQILGRNSFLVLSHPFGKYKSDYYVAKIVNRDGKTIKTKKSKYFSVNNEAKIKNRSFVVGNQSWKFNDTIRLYEYLNDTIFSIIEGDFKPTFIFNLGKYKGDNDIMVERKDERKDSYVSLSQFFETNNCLYFLSQYKNTRTICRYNKNTKIFEKLLNKNGNHAEFYNDIDGGIDIWPRLSVYNSPNEWCFYIDAIELKQQLTEKQTTGLDYKHKDKVIELEKFANNLSVEDNPVLIFIKVKSEQ